MICHKGPIGSAKTIYTGLMIAVFANACCILDMVKGYILVVDDELRKQMYEEMLASAGYEHLSYSDAEDALYFLINKPLSD